MRSYTNAPQSSTHRSRPHSPSPEPPPSRVSTRSLEEEEPSGLWWDDEAIDEPLYVTPVKAQLPPRPLSSVRSSPRVRSSPQQLPVGEQLRLSGGPADLSGASWALAVSVMEATGLPAALQQVRCQISVGPEQFQTSAVRVSSMRGASWKQSFRFGQLLPKSRLSAQATGQGSSLDLELEPLKLELCSGHGNRPVSVAQLPLSGLVCGQPTELWHEIGPGTKVCLHLLLVGPLPDLEVQLLSCIGESADMEHTQLQCLLNVGSDRRRTKWRPLRTGGNECVWQEAFSFEQVDCGQQLCLSVLCAERGGNQTNPTEGSWVVGRGRMQLLELQDCSAHTITLPLAGGSCSVELKAHLVGTEQKLVREQLESRREIALSSMGQLISPRGEDYLSDEFDPPPSRDALSPSDHGLQAKENEDFGYAAGATVDQRLEASQQGAAQAQAKQREAQLAAEQAREALAVAIEAGDADGITQAKSEATQAAAESDEAARAAASFKQALAALEDVQRLQKRRASIGSIASEDLNKSTDAATDAAAVKSTQKAGAADNRLDPASWGKDKGKEKVKRKMPKMRAQMATSKQVKAPKTQSAEGEMEAPVQPVMTDKEARQIFVLFDADRSGTVDIDELVVFVKAIKGRNDVNPAAVMEVWDKDNSGQVTAPPAVAVFACSCVEGCCIRWI